MVNSSSTLAAPVEASEVKLPMTARGNRYANAPRELSRFWPVKSTGEVSYEPRVSVAGRSRLTSDAILDFVATRGRPLAS